MGMPGDEAEQLAARVPAGARHRHSYAHTSDCIGMQLVKASRLNECQRPSVVVEHPRELRTVADVEAPVQACEVGLNRLDRQEERPRDLPVGGAAANQLDD